MKKQFLFSFTAIICLLTFSVACKKNNDNSTPPANANVMLINASPGDSAALDFYFNDVKLNTQSITYPDSSGYLSVAPKSYTVKVAATNTINPLASVNYGIGAGNSYSVFAYDTLLSGKIKVFATQDDVSAPAAGKAKVRFFDLSPVTIAIDILVNDSIVFANRSYADNVADNSKGNFISMNAGIYTVKVKLAGSPANIPPLLTQSNINFSEGKIYTVFAKGTLTGTGVNTLGAAVIINK
jgi:hypothetical protein